MMYDMKEKNNSYQLLDGLHLVLLVDVREGVKHIPEVLKSL